MDTTGPQPAVAVAAHASTLILGAALVVASLTSCAPANDEDPPTDAQSDLASPIVVAEAAWQPPGSRAAPLFSDDFTDGLGRSRNGVGWHGGLGPNVSVANGVLVLRHPGKGSNECADSNAEQRFTLPKLKQVWIEYRFYLPENFFHRKPSGRDCSAAANQKFFRIWGGGADGYGANDPKGGASFDPIRDGSLPGGSYLYMQWGDHNNSLLSGQDIRSRWHEAFGPHNAGRWMQIRMHYRLASSEYANNGVVQLWVDGALKVSLTGKGWFGSNPSRNHFDMGYLLGWANAGYQEDTVFLIDDFRVFDTDPGW